MNPDIKCTCLFGNPSIAIAENCPVHAIPINKESEDEMWEEVGKLVMDGYDFSTMHEVTKILKQSFSISRKQK